MFKKKPLIKSLSPLRSSDRRRLADQIISDYQIAVPSDPASTPLSQPENEAPAPQQPTQAQHAPANSEKDTAASTNIPTLASLRNSLLPESTSSARFTTTSGPNSTPVSGTVYVGAHPGQEARVLWFQHGKNPTLIPTVYTLWHNPDVVPLLHTPDFVAEEKLRQGADLMIPGLVKARGSKWDQRATKGSVVAVAGMTKDTVPVWVGTCDIDISQLGDENFRSQKGIAVKGLHWEGDDIWNWATIAGAGGKAGPDTVDGWRGLGAGLDSTIENLTLSDAGQDSGAEGGVPLQNHDGEPGGNSQMKAEEEDRVPTTAEVDKAFHQAFLFSLYKAKQSNKGPNYGFDFPLQPSFLIANMVQPNLVHQSQHYNIKKTSWKNAKKYIKHLDKSGLVKSKDRNGGETVILGVDFDHQQIVTFVPYKLPSPKADDAKQSTAGSATDGTSSSSDPSKSQKLVIKICYRASSKLVPDLLSSKTDFYTAQQISSALKSYIDQRPELGGQSSSSITLDAFIANNILGSNPAYAQEDSRVTSMGRINRGALQKRILDDNRLCQPFYVMERSGSEASDQKPKPGLPPHINIVIEKRTGTKVVTRLSNLEPFFINPNLLAPELQKKCAGSCSVGQLQGGKTGLLEITIQGDQSKILTSDVLPKRGVDAKWIDVVDKTKPKKK